MACCVLASWLLFGVRTGLERLRVAAFGGTRSSESAAVAWRPNLGSVDR